MSDPLPAVVEAVRERLVGVHGAALVEQVTAYDDVHRMLQDALARLDEG